MKIFLRLAGALMVLLLFTILLMVLAVGQSRCQLEAYAADLESRGEIFDIARLAPPPPPEENNGAKELLTVARELGDVVNTQNRRHFQITEEVSPGWNTVVHRKTTALISKTETAWPEVHQAFVPLTPLLERIRDLSLSPVLEIQPDYAAGQAMTITGLNESIRASQLLSQEGILFLEQQKTPAAVDNALAILRLAEMNRKQHGLIFQLVSASQLGLAQPLTWEILQSSGAGADDLARLQHAWNQVRLADAIVAAWRMERGMGLIFFQNPTWYHFMGSRRALTAILSSASGTTSTGFSLPQTWDELSSGIQFALWSTFYRYADARQYLENYQTLIDAIPSDPAAGPWLPVITLSETIHKRVASAGIERLFSGMLMLSQESTLSRLITTQALITMTQTAIALQHHRLARGQYPDSLAELVPTWLPAIPRDPFDAEPLRYQKRSNDTYLLYSIGPNGKDEQGNSTKTGGSRRQGWLFGNDLVWPRVGPGP